MAAVSRYSAVTALPYPHLERAEAGLHAGLRHRLGMGEQADWTTLEASGPHPVLLGAQGRMWFEYRAALGARRS